MPDDQKPSLEDAKERLDRIIAISRVDLYKPIQIAEVLYHSRLGNANIGILNLETYRNPSVHWRNAVSRRLLGKISTSSARYQHDVWAESAMYAELLDKLDEENKKTGGAVEKYIYLRFQERQETVGSLITLIESAIPQTFDIAALFEVFETNRAIRRSVDKVYEVVVYSLMETIVVELDAQVTISIPEDKSNLLVEFADIAKVLFGLPHGQRENKLAAHVYRAGITNAADRGLDMWSNFGPAIQVKHLTLNPTKAEEIVNQVEGGNIVVVCRAADKQVIETVIRQISWGSRVRGIVTQSELTSWYERCLRGNYSQLFAQKLLNRLSEEFKREFARALTITEFLEEREYLQVNSPELWQIDLLQGLKDTSEPEDDIIDEIE